MDVYPDATLAIYLGLSDDVAVAGPQGLADDGSADKGTFLGQWAAGSLGALLLISGRHGVAGFNPASRRGGEAIEALHAIDDNRSVEAKQFRRAVGNVASLSIRTRGLRPWRFGADVHWFRSEGAKADAGRGGRFFSTHSA